MRNFTKNSVRPLQLTRLFSSEDYSLVLANEEANKNYPKISDEIINFRKIVIVSDGYDFEKRHLLISKLPKDVGVLAVNQAVKKWALYNSDTPVEDRRTVNALVMNNPYREALNCLPSRNQRYFPVCIASVRTNYEFLKKYQGDVYTYVPSKEEDFGVTINQAYHIDDYRNPVCAAIDLAFHFGVEKLMLLCCDDAMTERRDSAVQLDNGFWVFPQHLRSHAIIDAKLHWLTHQEDSASKVTVADYSSGGEYLNAQYITVDEDAINFFKEESEDNP